MLICQDGSYYVGSTNDIQQRIQDHAHGKGSGYTKDTRPVILAWYETHPNRNAAMACERQLKNWSRIKKNHLARGDEPAFKFGIRPWLHFSCTFIPSRCGQLLSGLPDCPGSPEASKEED